MYYLQLNSHTFLRDITETSRRHSYHPNVIVILINRNIFSQRLTLFIQKISTTMNKRFTSQSIMGISNILNSIIREYNLYD